METIELDDILGEAQPIPRKEPKLRSSKSANRLLFLDLETIPDWEREEDFDLPKPPPLKSARECMPADQFVSQSLEVIKEWFGKHTPSPEWLDQVQSAEQASKKPRAGLATLIGDSRNALAGYSKTLAVTPEYCRIVCAAVAGETGEVAATSLQNKSEQDILEWLWALIGDTKTIVTFNGNHFDLRVLQTRSAILDVAPSKLLDLTPWKGQSLDLMALRWPKGGAMKLKSWAMSLGIEVPAGDVDGGSVGDLVAVENWEKLEEYNKSDVEITRAIYNKFRGYYWE